MTWRDYVKLWSDEASDTDIAKAIGVAISTVGRWSQSEPKPAHVRAFALKYGRPVLEAFLAAGFLSEEQAGENVSSPDLRTLTDEQLLHEVQSRMKGVHDAQAQEPGSQAGGAELEEPTPIAGADDIWDARPGETPLESVKRVLREVTQVPVTEDDIDMMARAILLPSPTAHTEHAGISGTAPVPEPTQSDLDLAAAGRRPGSTPVRDTRAAQDEIYPDEEGPEDGA